MIGFSGSFFGGDWSLAGFADQPSVKLGWWRKRQIWRKVNIPCSRTMTLLGSVERVIVITSTDISQLSDLLTSEDTHTHTRTHARTHASTHVHTHVLQHVQNMHTSRASHTNTQSSTNATQRQPSSALAQKRLTHSNPQLLISTLSQIYPHAPSTISINQQLSSPLQTHLPPPSCTFSAPDVVRSQNRFPSTVKYCES